MLDGVKLEVPSTTSKDPDDETVGVSLNDTGAAITPINNVVVAQCP